MRKIAYLFCLFVIFISCKEEKQDAILTSQDIVPKPENAQIIADTFAYDVIIKNPNPNDLWTEQNINKVNKSAFIDTIFSLVYSGRATAYDFFEQTPLEISEIKEIEELEGHGRNNIGKIQFTEVWYFDEKNMVFHKEVLSFVLGYELKDGEGNVKGHEALFKIELNH